MKKQVLIVVAVYLVLGLIPYAYSPFSHRSSYGNVGRRDGTVISYVLVDRTHYQTPKVFLFNDQERPRLTWGSTSVLLDGKAVNFGDTTVMFLDDGGALVPIPFDKNHFTTSADWSSGIYGALGPVPHFKSYQIEHPNESILEALPRPSTQPLRAADSARHGDGRGGR